MFSQPKNTKGEKAIQVKAYVMCQCHPTLKHGVSAFKTKVNVKKKKKIRTLIDH